MKKTYTSPQAEIIELGTLNLIAVSIPGIPETTITTTTRQTVTMLQSTQRLGKHQGGHVKTMKSCHMTGFHCVYTTFSSFLAIVCLWALFLAIIRFLTFTALVASITLYALVTLFAAMLHLLALLAVCAMPFLAITTLLELF